MRRLLILLLFPLSITAQKLPDFGLNKIRIVYPDQTVVAQIEPSEKETALKNDRVYYWYSSNIIHSTQGGFSGRVLNGLYTAYYPNKSLKEQGFFKDGLKDGVWKTWLEDGKLQQELTWKNGTLSGYFNTYTSTGNLKQSGAYKNDLLDGKITTFRGPDSGQVAYYRHGMLQNNHNTSIWQKLHLKKHKQDSTTAQPSSILTKKISKEPLNNQKRP